MNEGTPAPGNAGGGESGAASSRTRLLIAGGLAAALAVVVVAITAFSGDDRPRTWAEAPADCLAKWNEGITNAKPLGRHQYVTHGYNEVRVARIADDQQTVLENVPEREGRCVIVFAATTLDPERASLAQIHTRLGWRALSELAGEDIVIDLHADAFYATNADLQQDGEIVPLDPPPEAEIRTTPTEVAPTER